MVIVIKDYIPILEKGLKKEMLAFVKNIIISRNWFTASLFN